jgi:hypothetical protein
LVKKVFKYFYNQKIKNKLLRYLKLFYDFARKSSKSQHGMYPVKKNKSVSTFAIKKNKFVR